MTRALLAACALAAVAAAACHETVIPTPKILAPVATLDTKPLRSLVELDGNLYLFDDAGVTVMRAGAVVARDELPRPAPGTVIAAPDGEGRWVMSALTRITPEGETAPINEERLGLTPGVTWGDVVGAGETFVATSPKGLAVASDGRHVAMYPPTDAKEIAVARGRLALASADHIEVWDLVGGTSRSYPLAGAHVAFVETGNVYVRQPSRLVAWTAQQLAIEGAGGALRPIAAPAPIAGVAVSGTRLWVLADGHVSYLDASSSELAPAAVGATRIDKIFGSPSGDVWAMVGGKLARFAIPAPALAGGGGDAAWSAQIAPVFARVCAHCHLPDGSSGVDLSTAALWQGERAEIGKRVVVQRSMPPAGTAMADADRATIAAWAGAK